MTTRFLKSRHRDFWNQVERGVMADLQMFNGQLGTKDKERISHNAAFLATLKHHIEVAGATR